MYTQGIFKKYYQNVVWKNAQTLTYFSMPIYILKLMLWIMSILGITCAFTSLPNALVHNGLAIHFNLISAEGSL